MRVLGIESSCDETAAAVVEDGRRILSNVVASQIKTHFKYGGVVPELASREHLRAIVPIVREALGEAGLAYRDLDAIAVTQGPGLIGSLLVGVTYAKSLSHSLGIPLIGVNHVEGHIHAVLLEQRQAGHEVELPTLALVVSGGHSHIFHAESADNGRLRYSLAGKTRDDAAGEAYDKVAKLLAFGYPGGPVLDKLAKYGDPKAIRLPRPRMKGNKLDLSFSGLKTAVLRWVQAAGMDDEISARKSCLAEKPGAKLDELLPLTPQRTRDLVAAFQATVVAELVDRVRRAAEAQPVASVIVSGGVAANSRVREQFAALECPVYFPSLRLSTDNAAMIAAVGTYLLERGDRSGMDLEARANLPLAG